MILYFSGTGNTEAVAKLLGAELNDSCVMMDVAASARNQNVRVNAAGQERIIWCFPIYSWGVPPAVVKFIRTVEITGAASATHFMVCTCGDDTGLADKQWRRLIKQRGWSPSSASSIQMPNTYVTMKGFDVDSVEVACSKLSLFPEAVKEAAECIRQNKPGKMVRGSFAWIKSRIIYPWFIRHAMNPKPFCHNSACIACGACISVCPMKNITPDSRKEPVWSDVCAFCLACYHVCPRHAVMYGKATSGKGQYPGPDKIKCPGPKDNP